MLRYAAPVVLVAAFCGAPLAAQNAQDPRIDALFNAIGMPEIIEIMREEGVAYGETLAEDMLPGGPTAQWMDAVNAIYDPQMMVEEVRGAMGETLEGADIDAMLAFFNSDLGETIVDLEVSARRALLDEAVEEASVDASTLQILDETPRYLIVKDFVEANNLIESNVVGALNSSYAFYLGLIDGGVMPSGMTPEAALQEVWAQEDEIRDSTTEWVYSFLLMAYQPLSDEELMEYITFSESDAGQDMTAAMFLSLNGMFDDISRALGMASARFMASQEL